jgi:glycosyltransferase involved in cell wall biosynthesis
MKLGLWGARMDNSGLGMQTWEFYNAMKPAKTLVVDISMLEKTPARVMKQYPERYIGKKATEVNNDPLPNVTFVHGIPNDNDIREFLQGLDVVFVAESAYNFNFYRIAREMGVKTAVQYNYEFFDWVEGSIWSANPPDLFIAPSTWHYDDVSKRCADFKKKGLNVNHVYLHCPVNRDKIERRFIDSAMNFVHIAGRPAEHDRNGTYTFLQAVKASEGKIRGIVYTQDDDLKHEININYPSLTVKYNTTNYADMYKKGSVLVLPRKYGGNCLPMNEALAAGMPVIMSKLSPQIDFLPDRWLVEATETDVHFAPRFNIPVYECDPAALLFRMLWFSSLSNQGMKDQVEMADSLAESISWKEMKPKYEEVLEALCKL